MITRKNTLRLAACMALAFSTAGAWAQDANNYPSKTISLVVPYAAGGSSDTRARQIAAKMATYLGKSIIVENKPGAAGNIGTDYIAKAAPDGHVIGIGNLAPLTVNKAMFAKLKAGGEIPEHTDAAVALRMVHRVHIPIVTNDQVHFFIDGVDHKFGEGEMIELDNTRFHAVKNDSPVDRIHLIVDYYHA